MNWNDPKVVEARMRLLEAGELLLMIAQEATPDDIVEAARKVRVPMRIADRVLEAA